MLILLFEAKLHAFEEVADFRHYQLYVMENLQFLITRKMNPDDQSIFHLKQKFAEIKRSIHDIESRQR